MSGRFFSAFGIIILAAALAACGSMAGADPAGTEPVRIETLVPGKDSGPAHVVTVDSSAGQQMRVLWTVSSYVIGPDATWTESDAQALIFKGLDINDTQIIFDGQACSGVTFQSEEINLADTLSAWKTTPAELGITDGPARLYKTNCTLPGFAEYLRLNDRRLIVPINGVFFIFQSTAIQ